MERIDAFKWLWNYHIEGLREFLENTESGIASEFDEFSKWVSAQTESMSEDQVEEFIDHYYDDLAMVRDTVPNLLRHAQFMVIYGSFEHEAGRLCRALHSDGKAAKKPPKNLYLHDSKQYLMSEASFKASAFGKEWILIDSARDVRNSIAHNGGRLLANASAANAVMFMDTRTDMRLSGTREIIIDHGFCDDLLDQSVAAMNGLITEAERLY